MAAELSADPRAVRDFVLAAIEAGEPMLARRLAKKFKVSRPTAYNYLGKLADAGLIERAGRGDYRLQQQTREFHHRVAGLEEHKVWNAEIQPLLADLPENVRDIWHYGCTEMINNVIDHSESDDLYVKVKRSGSKTEIGIHDAGVGIFRKIARALNLDDDRHAVLELSKGKVTTDPDRHTGEGIFFSSRAFDLFRILSGVVHYQHEHSHPEDYILGEEKPAGSNVEGTTVVMTLGNASQRQLRDVFDEYATNTEDYRFDRTVVPVKLLQYGDDRLISRSQAKRLLARFEKFRTVILDFRSVENIGQAFADEVFRVFPAQHPAVEILPINANEPVARAIHRALSGREPQGSPSSDQG